jgi:hypothetical protein
LEDENGDPWYFDSLAKLCNYHDTSRKTLVGPGHFAYQYLRQSGGKYRLRYWTPGVAEAVVTEWDNPNETLNSTGWKALFFDANSFPVALGTRCTGVYSDEYPQQGERDLICGMGDPASGAVTEVEQWTNEDAEEGTQHLRVESSINGAPGIHWPTLTDDDLMIEVNDWAFFGGAGDLPLYYPDDEDDEFAIKAFNYVPESSETMRYGCQWFGQTFQRSQAQRFDEGLTVSVIDTAKPAINLKGLGVSSSNYLAAYISGASRISAGADGSEAPRIAGVPTNSWGAFSSDAPEHTDYLGFENPALSITAHSFVMYNQSGYIVERPGEETAGTGEIGLYAPTYTSHVASRAPFRSAPTAKEDSIGWYYEFIPPTLRALVRYDAPLDISPDAIGAWPAWLISHSHQVESLDGDPSYIGPAPNWYKAMIIPDVTIPGFEEPQDVFVKVRGVYFPTGDAAEEAPVDSFTHAGVHV